MNVESTSWVATIVACVVTIAAAFQQFGREKMLKSIALICVVLLCVTVLFKVLVLNPRPAEKTDPATARLSIPEPSAPGERTAPGVASDVDRTPTVRPKSVTNTNGTNLAPIPAATFAGRVAGELKTVKVGEIEVVLCWCPPGSFTMGSPKTEAGRSDDEGPVEVQLTKGFWVMRTEMTQELYEALMGKNPSRFKGAKLPVETVSYTEAVECAAKITQTLHEAQFLPAGWEIRLPTEAQWEYAARAGTTTATPFGDSLSSVQANFNGNIPYGGAAKGPCLGKTTVVGSYGPNAWGLVDTVGNVWEWTLDGYDAKLSGGSDPFVSGASVRVVRGGSWFSFGQGCRSADRSGGSPGDRDDFLGFRLAAVQSVD